MVLMARKSPILASWHSMPTKAKIIAHSLEVSKKKVTSVSDIPPLKLPTCGLYKIKKTSSFSLHPGGLNILQAPSLLGWTPAQPMTSSPRWYEDFMEVAQVLADPSTGRS